MGRVVITIDEIIAGRGLLSNRETVPPSIEVFLGNGLRYGDNDNLSVNAGPGLGFTFDGLDAIEFDDSGMPINVQTAGPALMVMNTELAGAGLVPGPGSELDIDAEADPCMEQSFRTVTDAKFQMDGYRLVFATTYTTFLVQRNSAGVVLGVEQGESITEMQPLNISGYGYGENNTVPVQVAAKTNNQPSFYK